MIGKLRSRHRVTRGTLWFGLLGGAVAWFVHLVVIVGVVETGCVAGVEGLSGLIGLSAQGVILALVVAATVLTLGVTIASGLVAYWNLKVLRARGEELDAPVARGAGYHMTRSGIYLSILFVFIIVVETIPIFFVPPCL